MTYTKSKKLERALEELFLVMKDDADLHLAGDEGAKRACELGMELASRCSHGQNIYYAEYGESTLYFVARSEDELLEELGLAP